MKLNLLLKILRPTRQVLINLAGRSRVRIWSRLSFGVFSVQDGSHSHLILETKNDYYWVSFTDAAKIRPYCSCKSFTTQTQYYSLHKIFAIKL